MDEIFFRLVNSGFLELAGLRVHASIPVPEHIVNEIIQAALRGNRKINECRVSIDEQNRVNVHLRTSLWPWPLHLKLRLEKSVDFTRSPTIRASLENHVLLGKLGALSRTLPSGIRIEGDQVVVDVRAFLSAPEQIRILNLVKSAEIKTQEAKLILDVKIEVE